jgi:DNA-binding NarL/FixJ family response regulator
MTQDKDRHAELRAMADQFPGAVVVVGEDGNVLFLNRAAQQLFGENHDPEGQPLESLLARHTAGGGSRAELESLTTRQREVLQLIAEGWPTRDIAKKLELSVKTIETHRAHLMHRLKVDSVARLVRYAVSAGLVPPHP